MTFGSQWERACIGTISTPLEISLPFTTSLDYANITSYEYVGRIFVDATYGTDGYSTSTFSNISTATSGFIAADPIVVGFQEHDLLSFPAGYVSSLAERYDRTWTAAATASPSASAAGAPSLPAQTNPSSEPPNSPGLQTGAKVGIGVGVGIVTIALAVLGAFVFWRKRTKLTEHQEDNGTSGIGMPEMEDRDEVLSSKKWYLFGKWRNEMPAGSQRQELDPKGIHVVNQVPVELEASETPQELEPNGVGGVQACEGRDERTSRVV
jgi:hypothetical protein